MARWSQEGWPFVANAVLIAVLLAACEPGPGTQRNAELILLNAHGDTLLHARGRYCGVRGHGREAYMDDLEVSVPADGTVVCWQ